MRANNGDHVNALINPADGSVNPAPAYFDNVKVTVTGTEAALINAGFAPNAEIVYNIVDEKPVENKDEPGETTVVVDPAETTAQTVEAPEKDGSFPVVAIIIAVVAIVVAAVVVVIVKKKK